MNKTIIVAAAIILVIAIAAGFLIINNNKKDETTNDANDNNSNTTENTDTTLNPSTTTTPPTNIAALTYKNGTYSAEGSYSSPAGTEKVGVSITVENDIVTDITVTNKAKDGKSKSYQNLFIGGISGVVEGKTLSDINVGKVNGSSLTGGGFNSAVNSIREQAMN